MLQFGYNTGVINAPEQVSCELAQQQLEMLMSIFLICLIHFNIKVLIKTYIVKLCCKFRIIFKTLKMLIQHFRSLRSLSAKPIDKEILVKI